MILLWSNRIRTISVISLAGFIITFSFLKFIFIKHESTNVSNETSKSFSTVSPLKGMAKAIATRKLYKPGFREIGKVTCSVSAEHLLLLVIVTSPARNVRQRMTLRKTWGHCQLRNDVSLGFLIGYNEHHDLSKEISSYNDIIVTNNEDHENSTVLQSISMLEYVALHCAKAPYVLKTQDDTYINIPILLSLLDYQIKKGEIYGSLQKAVNTSRNVSSPNYISKGVFSGDKFPKYVAGNTYVFSGDSAESLFATSLELPFIAMEGMFITGFLAERLKIQRNHVHELRKADGGAISKTEVSYLIALPYVVEDRFYKMWQVLSNRLMDY